jgi:hypothetical protein
MCPLCLTTTAAVVAASSTAAGGGLLAFALTPIRKLKRMRRIRARISA